MSGRFEAPKGTFDYLPPTAHIRAVVEGVMLEQARLAGYQRIETPTFEDTALFARGVGESTDVVQKEMYTFVDKGGRSLTLRPELTAGVIRALIEHGRLGGPRPAGSASSTRWTSRRSAARNRPWTPT
jgi:histidyl-tRNA synthetase